jgi:hypothetical protein
MYVQIGPEILHLILISADTPLFFINAYSLPASSNVCSSNFQEREYFQITLGSHIGSGTSPFTSITAARSFSDAIAITFLCVCRVIQTITCIGIAHYITQQIGNIPAADFIFKTPGTGKNF